MKACTTQAPFGNNEPCRFHVGQPVRIGTEEPISVNSKWASDTFAYQNPSQKPFGQPWAFTSLKGKTVHFRLSYVNQKRLSLKTRIPPNDRGCHVPSPVLPPLLYLTVCLSSSEDLICALNMSLWMSISWRRFCIAYNDRGNNQLNITFKNRIGSVGSLQIRGILQCKRWYYEKRSPAILNVETERELGRVKKWFQGRWIS